MIMLMIIIYNLHCSLPQMVLTNPSHRFNIHMYNICLIIAVNRTFLATKIVSLELQVFLEALMIKC